MGSDREALMAHLGAKPGAVAGPVPTPAGRAPPGMIYKVSGKMFAIVGLGAVEHVIVKSDPVLIEVLKQSYAGVGHRSHLDRRFWISILLNADVPVTEVFRLADQSYDRVRTSLTRKQQAALAS
jgi:predicted DNA-binding protein (MmcQ/YjbR family)